MTPDLETCLAEIEARGYVVLHDVAPLSYFDDLQEALAPLLDAQPPGRTDFEGFHTKRVGNLLAKGEVFQGVAANEGILELVEAIIGEHIQVSIMQAIQILPGENAQGLHTDDALYPLPHPHPPVVFNTMWALDDFTEANGATRLIPGSHRWEDPLGQLAHREHEVVAAEMPRGSVLAWLGNLIHEGGANTTERPRLGITMNYNQAWLRQQENQYLGLTSETVAGFPERLQRLVGWDIHPPFIGNLDGRNPLKLLRASDSAGAAS